MTTVFIPFGSTGKGTFLSDPPMPISAVIEA